MGGSGGGGGYFHKESPESRASAVRNEEERTRDQFFETRVAAEIGDLLSEYNERDSARVRGLIDEIRASLQDDLEDATITPSYGGSFRKHTYVDGISDIDSLFVLKGEQFSSGSPEAMLDLFERQVRDRFPDSQIRRDKMAVTIEREGLVLQLLPAVRREGRLAIPSETGKRWSEIKPEAFFEKLSEVNQKQSNKVVPTIKVVKGINDRFPVDQKLSGYHIESLAIEAFKNYSGPQNTKAMLEHFFKEAKQSVLSPIRDKTGQSVHVDEYLGRPSSKQRRAIAANLARVETSMKNADAIRSISKWRRIISEED